MKKRHIFALVVITAVILLTHQTVTMADGLHVYANGKQVAYDVKPLMIDNRVMVPIRYTSEFLDAMVDWNPKNKQITIYEKGNKVTFFIDQKEITVNGKKKQIDIAPRIYRSRTLVPVRFLVEAFGYDVTWDQTIQSVIVNTSGKFIYPQNEIQVPVLMYHHFDPSLSENATIHPDEFKEQMEYLKKHGYQTITNEDYVLFTQGKKNLGKKTVMITMDDGYESNYIYAYPILKELGMKATIYVIGNRIRENNDSPYTPYQAHKLSWEQAREMYEAGVMDIQNHTYAMHSKAETRNGKLDAKINGPIVINGKLETHAQYVKRVRDDLLKNKALIEKNVGNKVIGFAYPYGIFSEEAAKLVKETGHQLTVTVRKGTNKKQDGAYNLYRINVPPETTGKELVEMFK